LLAITRLKHWTVLSGIISLTNFNAQFSIHQQHICYTIILDMFRASTCPSSGGKIAFTQHLVSSLSVNGYTVHRLRALNRCTVQPLVSEKILYYDARSKKHQMSCQDLLEKMHDDRCKHFCVFSSINYMLLRERKVVISKEMQDNL
jgi:hypothetical protein